LPPVSIPYKIFQYLEQFTDDQEFLNEMYQLDENYLDKRYFLQSMNHNDRLQNLLRKSAQICYERNLITQQERDEFFISVTAKEIYRALQNNMNQSRRIVCFFREIRDIDKLDSKFYENENQDLLEEIKSLLHRSIHSSDIYTYQVDLGSFEWRFTLSLFCFSSNGMMKQNEMNIFRNFSMISIELFGHKSICIYRIQKIN